MKLDTSELESSIRQLTKESPIADAQLVTMNGTQVLKLIAFETPKQSGFARAGWTPSWQGLGITGKPYTRKTLGSHTKGNKRYVVDGSFIDNRNARGESSVEFVNSTFLVWTKGKHKLRVNYIFDLDDGSLKTITGKRAGQDKKGFMQKAVNRASFKFSNIYERKMKKFSSF